MANCNEFLEAMLGAYGARVAFGRQLVEKLEAGDYDLSGLLVLVTGGAALSTPLKQRFLELLPALTILDAGGSSESGSQMGQLSSRLQRERPLRPEPGCGGGQRGPDPDPLAGRRRDRLAGSAGPDPARLPG
ncbi:MAG: fatty-acid--CoA ligase [Mycobacterium sp.]|jgi:hypothetical protein|nr:fatty-acid--CoA ligase [Mycobacterium sp.]